MNVDLKSYDYIIVATSGGKDSQACILYLLDLGVPPHKIELWHHLIDGREGSTLMDWPITESYCLKFADAFGMKIFYSWKQGGFEREMLRENSRTAPICFEHEREPDIFSQDDNIIECGLVGGNGGKLGTRRMFPQVTADLSRRWCSAYLKIDVCTAAINHQRRFLGKRTLVITGERAEESPARAKYKTFEPDRSHRMGPRVRRHVDHWRPVHAWPEEQVWDIIKRYKVNPHPAYQLGWGRLSCISCIFGSPNQWASIDTIHPEHVKTISEYEREFGKTIHRTLSVLEQIARGEAYQGMHPETVKEGLNKKYRSPIIVNDWHLPAGAFGENAGPS